jgi:predicted RNA-binding Zn ribbon-like protein
MVGKPMEAPVDVTALPLHGGWLCLDFTNTVEPRHGPAERDWLHEYPDLVAWAVHVRTLDKAVAARLLRRATASPRAAVASFTAAINLREVLFRLFAAVADGRTPAVADLDALQRAYADAVRHARFAPRDGGGFDWAWDDGLRDTDALDDRALDRPWWPVVASAVELLRAGPVERVKRCPSDGGCSWLFVDATKNRSRRWCSMDDCGSDVKARRQTARRRAARRGESA